MVFRVESADDSGMQPNVSTPKNDVFSICSTPQSAKRELRPTPIAYMFISEEPSRPPSVYESSSETSSASPVTCPSFTDESRRSSCSYPNMSEDSFPGSTFVDGFPQPMTPTNGGHRYNILANWVGSPGFKTHVPATCGIVIKQPDDFSAMSLPPILSSTSYMFDHAAIPSAPGLENLAIHGLPFVPPSILDLNANTGMKATLFPQMYGLDPAPTVVSPVNVTPTNTVLGTILESPPLLPGVSQQAARNTCHQQEQVVVPSQLDHEDDYVCVATPMSRSSHDFTPSKNLGDWEFVKPESSPYETCCMGTIVEPPAPPTPTPRSRRRTTLRRSSKSPRHTANKPPTWSSTYNPYIGCHIDFETSLFHGPDKEGNMKWQNKDPEACKKKAHACTECSRKFARLEHLKRHTLSHIEERPYFCPLPSCDRRIGRSDNARDHIKTHLRQKTSGRRNKQCSWAEMERNIRERYPVGKVQKLLDDLSKWYIGELWKGQQQMDDGEEEGFVEVVM